MTKKIIPPTRITAEVLNQMTDWLAEAVLAVVIESPAGKPKSIPSAITKTC